ncbi:MAG TPA: endonuclease domain-containing protein [Rhizomicrobium sp.]|nr:endonuclease domain-containing protein [Rhizomicrobium sp.]
MADMRARQLRANLTKAERNLWFSLRPLKFKGLHFRRQAPMGNYIVDFVCHGAKLVIELDGSQHAESENIVYDAARTKFLESRGYSVLRFWNSDVLKNRNGIMEAILATAEARIVPSPCGEVEKRGRGHVAD